MIHNERKNLMQSDAEYLRGFALFMSELFVHMSPKEGTGKFRILGIAVRELLQTLLSHPTPGNVKCLCQILKVSSGTITKMHLLEVQPLIFVFSYLDRTLRMTTAPVIREKLSKWTCWWPTLTQSLAPWTCKCIWKVNYSLEPIFLHKCIHLQLFSLCCRFTA